MAHFPTLSFKRLAFVPALLFAVAVNAQHTGTVFIDSNGNGVRDSKESAAKGVVVSDGLNVTTTDSQGHFSLPGHEGERFIFITTPSGFKTFNKHYIPISPSTESYSFGIIPYDAHTKSGAHRFIQVTDSEIFNTEGNDVWVDDIRRFADNEDVAFVVHTGDICYEKGLKEHIGLMNTRNMDVPVYYCIGNHDLVKGKYGEELFESIYGPVYYSFDCGNTHYVVIPMGGGDHRPGYTRDEVARWLRNDLSHVKPGTPIVVFNHDILSTDSTFVYGGKTDSVDLNAYNIKANIYGHWHINHIRQQGKFRNMESRGYGLKRKSHYTPALSIYSQPRSYCFSPGCHLVQKYYREHIFIGIVSKIRDSFVH